MTTAVKKTEGILPKSEEWNALVLKVVGDFEIGQLIPHEWLKSMFRIKELDFKDYPDIDTVRKAIADQQFLFLQLFDRLRKDVLKGHSLYLVNVRGEGYKFIHPKDQTQYAYDQLLSDISKSFRECNDIMTHVQAGGRNTEQQAVDRALFSKAGNLKQLFQGFK